VVQVACCSSLLCLHVCTCEGPTLMYPRSLLICAFSSCPSCVPHAFPCVQTYYRCITCNFTRENGGKGVCEPCARICHAGHTLSPAMSGRFYCDCGNEKKCKELARARAGVAAEPAAGTTTAPPCQWRNQAVTRKYVGGCQRSPVSLSLRAPGSWLPCPLQRHPPRCSCLCLPVVPPCPSVSCMVVLRGL
jgi:hypothetical protein